MKIIPQPLQVDYYENFYTVTAKQISIGYTDKSCQNVAEYLKNTLKKFFNKECSVGQVSNSKVDIKLTLGGIDKSIFYKIESDVKYAGVNTVEAYVLEVDQEGVRASALDINGLFNSANSILQLTDFSSYKFMHTKIIDYPRYEWRGYMLDTGRHFYSVEFLKKLLDIMALYKLNKFHWHLTEDQGWRIEIKSKKQLQEIGAWRRQNSENVKQTSSDKYGGYYTQEQVKDMVAYGRERFIDIIPEVELPGHSSAAIASYPNLSCTGIAREVPNRWGIYEDIYCAGNDQVFDFLKDVLKEIVDLFPFKYVHIGGDEAPKNRWKECPKCQKRIQKEGLENEHELQSWFISQIAKYMQQFDRQVIGWDEILEGGIPSNAVVMSWRGMIPGILAAKEQHQVIMTPTRYCYFDYRQSIDPQEPGYWLAELPLEVVYCFDPIPEYIPKIPNYYRRTESSKQQSTQQYEQQQAEQLQENINSQIEHYDAQQADEDNMIRDSNSLDDIDIKDSEAQLYNHEIDYEVKMADTINYGDQYKDNQVQVNENPYQTSLTPQQRKYILGGQGNLWTEYVGDEKTAEYMTLPRLLAMSETLWSPKQLCNWFDFKQRAYKHQELFEKSGYNYRPLDIQDNQYINGSTTYND